MDSRFRNMLSKATRLTKAGDVKAAAATILTALRRTASPPPRTPAPQRDAPWIIDVETTPVHGAPAPMATSPLHGGDAGPGHEPPKPHWGAELDSRFVSGVYPHAQGVHHYKLFIPPHAHAPRQPLPLIVMLHGCTQDPDDFAAGTGMNDAAREEGFFVLYPAQTQHANLQRCWNWFKHNHQQRDRGEPALLAGMVRSVMREHPIDPARVYVAGLSAGGAMAAILGDAYPDVFAAVGVHSGLPTGSASDVSSAFMAMRSGDGAAAATTGLSHLPGLRHVQPAARTGHERPVRQGGALPTIVFHGDCDSTVHPANAERVIEACTPPHGPASPVQVEQQRSRSRNGRHYTRRVQRDASGRTMSEHWLVHGAGHAWSGGRPGGSYTDPQGPDATREMVRFFFATRKAPLAS